jgi:hypothetical protein
MTPTEPNRARNGITNRQVRWINVHVHKKEGYKDDRMNVSKRARVVFYVMVVAESTSRSYKVIRSIRSGGHTKLVVAVIQRSGIPRNPLSTVLVVVRSPRPIGDGHRRRGDERDVASVLGIEQDLERKVGSRGHGDGQDLDAGVLRIAVVGSTLIRIIGRRRRVGGQLDRVGLGKGGIARAENPGGELLSTEFEVGDLVVLAKRDRSVGLHSPLDFGASTGDVVLEQDLLSVVDKPDTSLEGSAEGAPIKKLACAPWPIINDDAPTHPSL